MSNQHELTAAEQQQLLAKAATAGQQLLSEWGTAGTINIGDPIYLQVTWPLAHKGEHFGLVGMQPGQTFYVVPLSEKAEHRLKEADPKSGAFALWSALQIWHEHLTLMLRTELRIKPGGGRPSGLVLPS